VDDEQEEKPLVPPGLVGAAVYEGLPIVMAPLLSDVPHGLAKLVMSGEPIDADFGTPINRLAEFTRAEVDSIQRFAKSNNVTIPIVAAGPGLESGYHIDSEGPLRRLLSKIIGDQDAGDVVPHIGLNRSSVPHAMHEIGHASPIAGSSDVRRAFQSLGRTLGQGSTIGNLLRAAIAGNALAPPDENTSDTRRFMYDNAPALVGATMVPELIEEGRASLKALQGANEYGPGVMRTIAELAPAFGTYVASAAAPVIATMLAKHVVAALRGQVPPAEPKTAAPMPGQEVKAPGMLRSSASSAWKVGVSPPKPKTIEPDARIGDKARSREPAKPPSKTSYYKDMLSSLYNPQRGSRLAVPG
jgi:hypothetical protein